MKNYSNYHGVNFNDKLINDGNLILDKTLIHDVIIQGVPEKALIYEKYNNDNGNLKNIVAKVGKLKQGYIVEFNNQKWIVFSLPENNIIYEKATLRLCNNTLTLKGSTTEIIVGYNDFNEPITETISSEDIVIPCIVETKILDDETEQAINLPEGRINVTIPYTEHEDIAIDKEFEMYGEKYKIIGIDYTQSINKEGLIIINGKKVS
jgi:hypothetical protein